VSQMQAGTAQVELGVTTTSKAGESLTQIISATQVVDKLILQIADASARQTSMAGKINSNVEQIAKISGEAAGQSHLELCRTSGDTSCMRA